MPKFKVGDKVTTTYQQFVEGEIGEISSDKYYIWQNENNGSIGEIQPSIKGYLYSWVVPFSEENKITLVSSSKSTTMETSAISFLKNQALKLKDNDEYVLRKAGIHNDCGELTSDGKELVSIYTEELVHKKLVDTAREMLADEESKKGKK